MARSLIPFVFVVLALSGAACGNGAESSSPSPASTEPHVTIVEVDGENLLRLVGDEDATEPFATAIADGILTYAEYEAGLLEYTRCMLEAGIEVSPKLQPDGTHMITNRILTQDHSVALSLSEPCSRAFQPYMMLWAGYEAPGYQDLLVVARAEVATCLRENGVDIAPDAASDDFKVFSQDIESAEFQLLHRCLRPVQERHGLETWLP